MKILDRARRLLTEPPAHATTNRFALFCQIVLFSTGLVKIVSYFFYPSFEAKDPVFGSVSVKSLSLWVGMIELGAAGLMSYLRPVGQLLVVFWLSSGFVGYRVANYVLEGGPCSCLGNLVDVVGPFYYFLDKGLLAALTLMFGGSAFLLLKSLNEGRHSAAEEMIERANTGDA